ncbi:unnamed protein product [Symbiodinium microadriaticum]|nr:unnamed protein product [Symbiodinium microadriaticum]
MAHRYPFRHWAQDVLTWSIAADGDPSRKAALLTMSLKGTAYEFCRTIPPMTLLHGGAINGHHVDPLTYVMHALAERFADLGEELRLTSITDLFNFARLGNERIDELITRFDLTRQRSFDLGQLTMSVTGLAYILLRACEVSDSQLMQLLLPLQGRFPNTEDEFQVLKTQLRRMGHIVEHAPGNIAAALRSRSSHPQYLATEQGHNNLDSQQSAFVAYGGAEQAHVSGAGGWGYGSDNIEGISSSIAQPAGGADAHAAYLAEMDSDGATDTDTASSTGMTEVPTATPEGWTDDTSLQEHLFWSYSRAKATWRKFMARPTRAVRRFTRRHISRFSSKGKGKRWPKGRPNVAAFLTSITDDEAAQIFAGPLADFVFMAVPSDRAGVCPFPTAVVWAQSPPTMPEWAQMPVFGFLGPPRHVDPAHVPLIAQVSSLEGPMTQTLDSMATATQATSRRWLGEAMEGPGPQATGSVATSQLERTQQGQIQTFHQAQQVVQTRRAQHRNRHRRIIQVPDTWDHQGYDALDDSCALCREVYLERDSVVRLVCRHLFHTTCWAEYLMHPQARMSCPVCRGSARVIARFSYRAEYETPGPSQPTSEHQSRAPSADSPNQAPAESESGTRTPTRRPETFEMNTPPQATTGEEEAGGSPYNFEAFHANMIFPWWPSAVTAETPDTMVLHSTSHDEFQCILIDPGAYTNLAGLHWVRRLAQKCHALSLPVTQNQLNSPLSIAGVGNGTQQCTWSVRLPIAVPAVRDGVESTARCHFETPVVGGSGANLPALLGLRSLRAKNAILVLSERDEDLKLLIPGPGGWEYELSPGSVEHRLMTAPSGHLLMRCDLYEKSKTAPIKDPDVSFLSTPAQQESSHVEGTSGDSDFGHGLAQRPAQQAQSSSSTSFAPPSGSAFPVQRFAPGPSNLGE